MSEEIGWVTAAENFTEGAEGEDNRLMIAEICRYIDESYLCNDLKVQELWNANCLYLTKADGSQPSKRLKVQAIDVFPKFPPFIRRVLVAFDARFGRVMQREEGYTPLPVGFSISS